VILHNPIETGDKHMLGTRPGFCNQCTGILPKDSIYCCQLYTPSGIYIGFLYPENGHIMELPTPENIDEVDIFADLARNKKTIK
jgi:hypothetical protein